jgi:glycosyltransferase involved in cell wall biosynthesis
MAAELIVFGEDWGRLPSSTQHLVRHLAKDRPVLWVNSIGLRRPRLDRADLARLWSKLWQRLAPPPPRISAPPNIRILAPLALPFPGSATARTINGFGLGTQIRRRLEARDRQPILWTSLPSAIPVIGHCGEAAVVYYCGDDFGALSGVDHAPVLALERELVARADLIIAASPALAAKFPADKTLLVQHGVDVGLFAGPAPRPEDLPAARPVAGFYGSISDWLDLPLLAATAKARADWDFVMIGPIRTDIRSLEGLENVTLLGPRPHEALPGYVQHWTVSLLPFRDNAQIRACNPLKLREYLAAGTPIVSTDFPALDGYRDLVEVASTANFAAALDDAAADTARNGDRQARIVGESWEARAAIIASALDKLAG